MVMIDFDTYLLYCMTSSLQVTGSAQPVGESAFCSPQPSHHWTPQLWVVRRAEREEELSAAGERSVKLLLR